MAGAVSLRWNQIWPNLIETYRRLKELEEVKDLLE
jgi:hypothetical protein